MNFLQSTVLGLVQGLTEFLPISSSGHLLLIPKFFGWEEPPLVFDTSLHLGTLTAVLVYFRKDIKNLFNSFVRVLKNRSLKDDQDGTVAMGIFLGCFPAGLAGLFLEDFIEEKLHHPGVVSVTLIVLGIFLWLADKRSKKNKTMESMGMKDALIIGFAQALALIPGTSRSGITMTAALFSNFDRETAARFSFLLGTPIIAAAGLYKLKDFAGMVITNQMIMSYSLGFIVSAFSGFLCIKFLLQFLKNYSFSSFAIYRVILGGIVALTLI